MGVSGFTENEMINATDELIRDLSGKGPVPLEPARSPISSPLRGWHGDKPVYIREEPEVIPDDDSKVIRRWGYEEFVVTIVSDFSNVPRDIDRSIEIIDRRQAGDGSSAGGT